MRPFYEEYWRARGRSGDRPRYRVFLDWIEPGASVLDLGCGDGAFGELAVRERGVSYLGADIAEAALELARARGLEVVRLDVEEGLGGLAGRRFDYVVASEVVEHVVRSEELLLAAAELAERRVLVSIPNIAYWPYRLQLLRGRFPRQWAISPREHVRYWSVPDFRELAESLGLAVEDVRASNGRRWLRDVRPNLFGWQVCFALRPDGARPEARGVAAAAAGAAGSDGAR